MANIMNRVSIFKNKDQITPTSLNNEFQNIVNTYNRNAVSSNTIFVNVKDYGATGNGVTDDGPSIANAYAAVVAAGGGILFIPAGTFLVNSTQISPVSNTTIMGSGQRATIINWAGSGYWLDNQTTGTIYTRFSITGMTVNCNNVGGGNFCRLGTYNQPFDESNQHIDFWFKDLLVQAPSIVAGSKGMQLNTMIRTHIEDCVFENFDITWDFQKFDEAYVVHNRLEVSGTYGLYLHNDTGNIFADESTFIFLDVVCTSTMTAAVYISQAENIRFFDTYLDAGGGGSVAIGWKLDSVHNMTIDGATLNSETQIFNLTNVRSLTIRNVGLQNPDQSPAPTSAVTYSYGSSTDLTGTGGPFKEPYYGLIHVDHCQYQVANSFKGLPGVSITSSGLNGGGESHFGGQITDVSQLYATQILDRNGKLGLLKETAAILSPFSSNTYLNGTNYTSASIVADATATTGYALKIPSQVSGVAQMDIVYPKDVLSGMYEVVARIRHGTGISPAFFAVYFDGALKENYGGINTATTYKLINARFNFNPANNPSTLSIRIDSSQDLYIDYVVLRPCFNAISYQAYVDNDYDVVGTNTTPGYKIIYSSAAPASGNWAQGDVVINTAPSTGGNAGWICTASGSPGTWKVFGPIGFSLSPSLAVVTASDSTLGNSTTTTTELAFVHGVTSAIQTQLNAKQSTALTSAHLLVGNGSNVATDTSVTGDVTISNAGVTSLAASVAGTHTFSGQLIGKGTATNDSAAAGFIGEYFSASQATPTNFAGTGTYGNIASISLTVGDWDVSGLMNATLNGATCTQVVVAVSLFSGNTTTDHTDGDNVMHQAPPLTASASSISVPAWRVSLSSPTTVYVKGLAQFSLGNPQYVGRISARRVR